MASKDNHEQDTPVQFILHTQYSFVISLTMQQQLVQFIGVVILVLVDGKTVYRSISQNSQNSNAPCDNVSLVLLQPAICISERRPLPVQVQGVSQHYKQEGMLCMCIELHFRRDHWNSAGDSNGSVPFVDSLNVIRLQVFKSTERVLQNRINNLTLMMCQSSSKYRSCSVDSFIPNELEGMVVKSVKVTVSFEPYLGDACDCSVFRTFLNAQLDICNNPLVRKQLPIVVTLLILLFPLSLMVVLTTRVFLNIYLTTQKNKRTQILSLKNLKLGRA